MRIRRCSGLSTRNRPPKDQNAWPPKEASGSWSTTITWRPASASSAVATRPARPAPITMTSAVSLGVLTARHPATPLPGDAPVRGEALRRAGAVELAVGQRDGRPGGRDGVVRGGRRGGADAGVARRRLPGAGQRDLEGARRRAAAGRLERDLQDVRAGLRPLGKLEAEGDRAGARDALARAGDDAAAADQRERRVAGAVGGERQRQAALGLREAQLARGDDVERAGRRGL